MAFDSSSRGSGTERKPGFGDRRKNFEKRDSNFTGNRDRRNNAGGFKSQRAPQQPKRENIAESARYIALNAFEDVVLNESYASMALDKRFSAVNLSQADKRLATGITYAALENLLRIDWILDQFLQERDKLPAQVIDLLRISVSQLFFFDRIPENAIVDEAVKICRFMKLEAMTGLVNAVLRGIIRKKTKIRYPDENDRVKYLSVMHSVPDWLVKQLIDGYGEGIAAEICGYRKKKHYITIRPNMTRFDDDSFEKSVLSKKVWEREKCVIPHAWRVMGISELARDNDYLAGNYSVHGESSILCAMCAQAKAGQKVLDCCAAPGGKTAYITESMNDTGRVYAWDVHDHRVALIRAMIHRLGFENVRPAVHDATVLKDDIEGQMDCVLLDAPCSGTGVMDDKPDIKFRLKEESVDELVSVQEKLLNTCCRYVKKGGRLIYSTCSVLKQENEKQIERFLASHPEFVVEQLPEQFPAELGKYAGDHGLQLLSYRDDTEGFFIAGMKRVK